MNQQEIMNFFNWCDCLKEFEVHDCDESDHFYFKGERIGGYAGDRRSYFIDQNDTTARLLSMMEAYNG